MFSQSQEKFMLANHKKIIENTFSDYFDSIPGQFPTMANQSQRAF